jgi:hypothetical protein
LAWCDLVQGPEIAVKIAYVAVSTSGGNALYWQSMIAHQLGSAGHSRVSQVSPKGDSDFPMEEAE